ncbi:MAG: hypothetical protein HQK75_05350 [Candidatus Magnetomorum sp.]|nr:hypothetical protein [Candidatus Magnetomorum sp.]
MKRFGIQCLLVFIICLIQSPSIARPNEPVAFLLKGDGDILFSRDGLQWDMVDRNKLLFPGNQIKTGIDGYCQLLFDTDDAKCIEKNTQVIIQDKDLKILSGNVTSKNKIFDFIGNLKRKFASIQKFTTVLRSSNLKDSSLKLAENLSLCDAYPTLAWENVGTQYSYQLTVQDQHITIPKSNQAIIRYPLKNITSGKHMYQVKVMDGSRVLYDTSSTFDWLSKEASKVILEKESEIRSISDQGFLMGNFMDEKGLKVVALDHYLNFFANSYQWDVRPFLIKVYKELGMLATADREVKEYNLRQR